METNELQRTNELTIDSTISRFTDEQIKHAIRIIDGDSPLYHALGLIYGMRDYIVFNDAIGRDIRDNYYKMSRTLEFYLELLKMAVGYRD